MVWRFSDPLEIVRNWFMRIIFWRYMLAILLHKVIRKHTKNMKGHRSSI